MELTKDTVLLFLLLMPGFLASTILNTLIVRKSPDGLVLIIEAFVFSFVIYSSWALLTGELLFTISENDGLVPGHVSRRALCGIIALSLLFPVVLGVLLTHDYLFRVLQRLKVTRRTGRASVWLDVFVEQQRCVIVNFKDGRRLFGWPEFYSDDATEGMLYLSSPAWLNDDGQYIRLGVRGFLISSRENIDSILVTDIGYNNVEFDDYGKQPATQTDAL